MRACMWKESTQNPPLTWTAAKTPVSSLTGPMKVIMAVISFHRYMYSPRPMSQLLSCIFDQYGMLTPNLIITKCVGPFTGTMQWTDYTCAGPGYQTPVPCAWHKDSNWNSNSASFETGLHELFMWKALDFTGQAGNVTCPLGNKP